MDIYWVKDKQRCGPTTVPDIVSRVQLGEIDAGTKGWHVGCENWVPLKELPALKDFLEDEEQAPVIHEIDLDAIPADEKEQGAPQDETDAERAARKRAEQLEQEMGRELTAEQRQAMVDMLKQIPALNGAANAGEGKVLILQEPTKASRLMARLLDCAIYGVLYMAVMYALGVPFKMWYLFPGPVSILPFIILEALMLSRWGSTPGKAFFGISVMAGNGGKLNFARALQRSIYANFMGMGLFMPTLMIISLPLTYWIMSRWGLAMWDKRCFSLPTQKARPRIGRYITAAFLMYMSIQIGGYFTLPWMPSLIEELGRETPELATRLREMMPPELRPDAPADAVKATEQGTQAPAPAPNSNDSIF